MSRGGWHMIREADGLTLARTLPVRFDVSAGSRFPILRRGRLAHLIRQDLWRRLRALRGFSPVVRIVARGAGLDVTAGGRVAGAVPPGTTARIATLLGDPALRARWIRDARLPSSEAYA